MQIFVKNLEDNIAFDSHGEDDVAELWLVALTDKEKKVKSLIKRINRLQWKQLQSHTTKQLEIFTSTNTKNNNNLSKASTSSQPPIQSENSSGLQSSSEITPLSTATGTTTTDKPLASLTPNVTKDVVSVPKSETKHSKRFDQGRPMKNVPPDVNQIVNNFTPSILDCAEDELLRSAVGIITANLKHLEYSYDSDATESSSGGESCDEFENFFGETFSKPNNRTIILEPIERKANWRWLNERSAIASRWTWLQAQVADLEFKIRQQNEMYRQLRASKGSIAFYCKESPTTTTPTTTAANSIPNNNSLRPSTSLHSITSTPKISPGTWSSQQHQVPSCTSSPSMSASPTTTTTTSTSTSTPLIQIQPPTETSNFPSKSSLFSNEMTTTTITTGTTQISTTTSTTDSLSIDVSTFKFAKMTPSDGSGNDDKYTNLLGTSNGTLNTQSHLSNTGNSGANINGLGDYSLPSVNSDSTISLSPPLETMAASTPRTKTPSPSSTPPPPSQPHSLPPHSSPSFNSTLQASLSSLSTSTTATTLTTAPTTNVTSPSTVSFTCPIATTTTTTTTTSTTVATTTTSTCTTTASQAITPQKQTHKDVATPSSEERLDANPVTNSEKEVHHCARTLPLKQMRKRKLVQSCSAISTASRKVARYSTIQCTCTNYPKFVSPCVLCNGRFSHLQMVDTDNMPNYERYALLDPSYHPVLSLPTDVALGLYFSKILKKDSTKSSTIQNPCKSKVTGTKGTSTSSTTPLSLSSTNKSTNKSRSAHSEFPFKFGQDNNKKTQLNRGKSQAFISSTKLKKKYDGTTKKKYAKKNNNLRKRTLRVKNDQPNGDFPLTISENSNIPIHKRRRSEQYAYDINNIVIPYSIASTTRVEKLQYKEIITPKWRCVEEDLNNSSENVKKETNEAAVNESKESLDSICMDSSLDKNIFKFDREEEETDEDISDEAFAIRHAKCEIEERRQRNLHLLRKHTSSTSSTTTTTTTTTSITNHHSPSTEIISSSSSSSLSQNSHAQNFQ